MTTKETGLRPALKIMIIMICLGALIWGLSLFLKPVFAQIYLDDVTINDGPTEILPDSHALGRLTQDDINAMEKIEKAMPCLAKRGDILICHYLMLHRSTQSRSGKPRPILRVDFANFNLPDPLGWSLIN